MLSINGATSLRETVVQRLRAEIVSGRVAAGTIYSVPSLATALGVSTTPVREALLELSRAGLVSPMRNRGFLVEAATLKDLEDLFAVRVLLERFALEALAKERLTNVEPLEALADAVAAAVKDEDVNAYIETDRRFHEALVARANNPRLTRLIMAQRDDMRLYGIDSKEGRERQLASVGEHYQMIEYGLAGKVQEIGELITKHIMEWEPLFAAALGLSQRQSHEPARGGMLAAVPIRE
ncbi:MAG: GntR family transcriptional regulator [Steroidobacteraceae bacterium]